MISVYVLKHKAYRAVIVELEPSTPIRLIFWAHPLCAWYHDAVRTDLNPLGPLLVVVQVRSLGPSVSEGIVDLGLDGPGLGTA